MMLSYCFAIQLNDVKCHYQSGRIIIIKVQLLLNLTSLMLNTCSKACFVFKYYLCITSCSLLQSTHVHPVHVWMEDNATTLALFTPVRVPLVSQELAVRQVSYALQIDHLNISHNAPWLEPHWCSHLVEGRFGSSRKTLTHCKGVCLAGEKKVPMVRHHGTVAFCAEGPWIEIGTGPKISCYACCALGQGILLSFAPLHPGELNGYWPTCRLWK